MLHVKCPECSASYKLSEDLYRRKAAGFGVVVTCRHCKTEIHVQNVGGAERATTTDADVFAASDAITDATTATMPRVAPKPAVGAPRPGGPPRPASPPRPVVPPRPANAPQADAITPSPTPTRATPKQVNTAQRESPRLVALSPGLLGVGTSLDKLAPLRIEPEAAPDSEQEEEDPDTQRPPPPVTDSDAPPANDPEMPIASSDFLDSTLDSAPALDSRDYTEEPSEPALPKPKRLPHAPPMRKLPSPVRTVPNDEPPSATSAPKLDALVHPPVPSPPERNAPPRKRQPSGDLTDDLLSADLGFDAPLPLAPPDAAALLRPPTSERPQAQSTASSSKPAIAAATTKPEGSKKSSRGVLWVLALVALGGSAFVFRDRLPGNSGPAPAAQAPAQVNTPAPTPAPEPIATAAPVPEPQTSASAEPVASAAPTPEPPATHAAPTPAATTTPTAAVATNKPSAPTPASTAAAPTATSKPTGAATSAPVPEPPRPEATGPFNVAAAKSALEAAAAQASSCRKPGDPSGVAVVTITYSPSGRVTSANIGGPPFAGTPTGGCIASTLRKARVDPFIGEMVTIRKTVTIQ